MKGKPGIICAGSMIVDLLKRVDSYPDASNLVSIREVSAATGGLVCNCIQDLARMDPDLPLLAVGVVGDDSNGHLILDTMKKYPNIDVSGVKLEGQTSFTDVMYENVTNTRTFFQFAGSNSSFDESYVDFDGLEGSILHAGYILLLDALDAADAEYGTHMARLLCQAQKKGIKTSIDIVSENSQRYRDVVIPALKYTDYCIINELEAERTTGIQISEGKEINEENMARALRALREYGVSRWVVIHSKFASYGMAEDGEIIKIGVYGVPREQIVSTTGAGDAFCSGVLYGAFKNMSLCDAMKLGTLTANCSLSAAGASDGVHTIAEMEKIAQAWSAPQVQTLRF